MRVSFSIQNMASVFTSSVLTIGNFDGVHIGHKALLGRVVKCSRELETSAVAMTFDPHPVKVLHPDRHLKKIFQMADMIEQLESLGIDHLNIEPFSREFSQLPPERFLREWIYRPFAPEVIVVGHDFSFGANRVGSIDILRQQAREGAFRLEVLPPVKVGNVVVSSSRIRDAIGDGHVARAADLLGRPFYLKGLVEKGAGRGKSIGFPTANLSTNAELLPCQGVYCGYAKVQGKTWDAVANVGVNPTFQEPIESLSKKFSAPLSIEVHLLKFPGRDFYGETLQFEFVERLRDEKKFASIDQLKDQISRDIEQAEKILDGQLSSPAKTPS